nr:MAG TPA: hypothetical protein [Caudoviricetes sp.]
MIDITKDIKNGTTTIVKYDEDLDLEPTQVTVTKKKVKTAKGDFESVKVFSKSDTTTFDETLKLLKVLEAVG